MNASTIVKKGLKAEKSSIASEIITWMNSNAKRHRTLVDLCRFLYFASKLARLPVTRLGGAGLMTDGWRGEEYTHEGNRGLNFDTCVNVDTATKL
jgi:hypothetical protein